MLGKLWREACGLDDAEARSALILFQCAGLVALTALLSVGGWALYEVAQYRSVFRLLLGVLALMAFMVLANFIITTRTGIRVKGMIGGQSLEISAIGKDGAAVATDVLRRADDGSIVDGAGRPVHDRGAVPDLGDVPADRLEDELRRRGGGGGFGGPFYGPYRQPDGSYR